MLLESKIQKTIDELNIDEAYLSNILGVTPKTLKDWKKRDDKSSIDKDDKIKRILRFLEVVNYLKSHYPQIAPTFYLSLFDNSRIILDLKNEESSDYSLMQFIVSDPNCDYWIPCVDSALLSCFGLKI
jgi:hypothetical protein